MELPLKKAPHTCEGFVVIEHGKKVTHLNTLKTICRMLEAHSYGTESSEDIWKESDLHSMHATHAQQTGV